MSRQTVTGGNGVTGQTGQQVIDMGNNNDEELYRNRLSDYTISKNGSTINARAREGSGLSDYTGTDAYTVIQAAITALTPAGAVGSGGGKIHICKGTYSLTDELIITGWEASGGPYSQLIITGEGWSTWLFQATAAKNCLIVKNKASVVLRDFKATCSQRSALLLDDSGADEMSTWKSFFDNVIFETSSTTHPAVHMKNFMNLSVGYWQIGAPNYHGLILENNSLSNAFGNSFFAHTKIFVSAAHAGMLVQSTDGVRTIGHCSFGYFEVGQGLYGIRTSYGKDFTFAIADIEQCTTCISLGTLGAGASNNTYNFTFLGGYLLPLTGGTAIHCAQRGFGNRFVNTWIDGDATSVPILDEQEFKNPNMYDVNLGFTITEANISITEASKTFLRTRSNSDYTTKTKVPTNTIHQQLDLADMNPSPSSASDTGRKGEIRVTATHIYVCTATNTWVRAPLATW